MATASTTVRSAVRTTRRYLSTETASHHKNHKETHNFSAPTSYIGSWEKPKTPEEAKAKLAILRSQYAKQVKEVRKEYIKEMELMKIEKQRKDEAKKEALRIANEERKKLKAEVTKVKAQEREIAREEFRQLIMKERAQKFESWRAKEKAKEEKKKAKDELLHKQSSLWVGEDELEEKILKVVIETQAL